MSKNGVWVRLPAERWQHISEEHPELAHFRTAVLEAIANTEYVLEGNAGEFLAVRPLDSSPPITSSEPTTSSFATGATRLSASRFCTRAGEAA